MSEPTLAEVVRRLEENTSQLRDIVAEMRSDRAALAATYVRKDVYDEARRADQRDLADLEERVDKWEQFRRQVLAGASVSLVTALIGIVVYISGIKGG